MRRAARILAKIVLSLLILVAVGALVLLLWARSESGRRKVRDVAVDKTRSVLPGLEIGRIGGDLTHTLVLEDVVLHDREGREAVRIDRVEAQIDLFALAHHEVRIERLIIVRPKVDGRANLAEVAQSSAGEGSAYEVSVQAIELQDGAYESPNIAARGLDASGALQIEGGRLLATIGSFSGRVTTPDRAIDLGGAGHVESKSGSVGVTVDRLAASGLVPAPLVLRGRWEDGHVDAQIEIGARGHAHVVGDVDGSGYRAEIDVNADPHDLDESLQPGQLDAHVSASGAGMPLAPGSRASALVTLDRSRIEGLAIARARVRGQLAGNAWRVESATVRALGLDVSAHGNGIGSRATIALDARADRAVSLYGARAAGRIHAEVSGELPRSMQLRADLDLQNLRFREIQAISLKGMVRSSRIQHSRIQPISFEEMHLVARNLSVSGVAIGEVVQIDGRAGKPTDLTVRISRRDETIDLALRGEVGPERMDVAVEKLEVERHDQRLALSAPARLRWQRGKALELGPAELSGEMAGVKIPNARVSASLDARARAANVSLDGVIGTNRAPIHLAARVPTRLRGPTEITLDAQCVRLQELPSVLFARRELRDGRVDVHARIDGDAADPRGRLDLTLRDARLGPVSQLAGELHAEAGAGAIRLRGTGAEGARRVLTWSGVWSTGLAPLLHGRLPEAAPIRLDANFEGLDLAQLRMLDPRLSGARGTLSGTAQVRGSLAQPSARLHADASGAQLDVVRFGRLDATADWKPGHLQASLAAEPAAGGRLHGTVDWSARSHAFGLHARALDLRFVPAIFGDIRQSGGTLDADLAMTTDADGTPSVTGTLAIHHGKLRIRGVHEFDDVELALRLAPGRAEVQRLHAQSGGGSLDGSGTATLDGVRPQEIDFNADARQFQLGYGGLVHARLDGKLHVGGGTVDDRIALRLNIQKGKLDLEQIGADHELQSTGPLADVRFVDAAGLAEKAKPASQARKPVSGPVRDLELAIALPDFGVRGKEVDAALDGRVAVSTTAEGFPVITGEVSVKRGSVEVFGQRFDIEHARLHWTGQPGDVDPMIDIRVVRAFADATVAVELTGTVKKNDIRLSSDPPIYDQTQLVAMVLGGQPQAGDVSQTVSPAGTISSVILSQIVDKIAPQLPLDILRVEQVRESVVPGAPLGVNDVTETRVEIGKHITDKITLSYVHLFGAPENQNQNEAHVDYRLGRRWIVETAFGDAGVGGVDVFWTWRY